MIKAIGTMAAGMVLVAITWGLVLYRVTRRRIKSPGNLAVTYLNKGE